MTARAYEEVLAPTQYYDRHFQIEAAKIMPGEYYVTSRDMLLVTTLGSCVSACIRDRVSGIGGMNHFMLANGSSNDMLSESMRYGAYAMEVLINQLIKLGAERARLEAKVFGGGQVLKGFTVTEIGAGNARFVIEYLEKEHIRVVAQDLLDIYPRKVYYFPKNGRVLVKKLKDRHNDTVVKREREYGEKLHSTRIVGDVELFQ
jgi:chemotaxis protein CheD